VIGPDRQRFGPSCVLLKRVPQGRTERGGIVLAANAGPRVPSGGVTLKRRCTYRPSVIYLIVNKLLSLSLSLSLPVCVFRPIRIFNRSKIVVKKGKQLAEKSKEAKDFFSDPKNLKLFQQYLKASAHLRVYWRSSFLTLFSKSLSCCLQSAHACLVPDEPNTFWGL
jgi:hypothetical protein